MPTTGMRQPEACGESTFSESEFMPVWVLTAHLGVVFRNQCSQVSADSDIKYMAVLDFLKRLLVFAYLI